MIKKITLGITFLFSTLMIASPAYADWEKLGEGTDNGTTFYVDFDRIRTNGGYVYYWQLQDLLEPIESGDYGMLSGKTYYRGDCAMLRYKTLSYIFYEQPMGEGSGKSSVSINKEWNYPPPNSPAEIILKRVCEVAAIRDL